jgi:hypothetical protein
MKRIFGRTLTPSFAISVLALAVALGGGAAWAAGAASPRVTLQCVTVTHFKNGWANVAKPAGFHKVEFCKDSLGYVHLDGVLTAGTAFTTAFVLPRADRPKFNHAYAVAAGTSGPATEDIDVFTNGDVFVNGSATDAVALDGVTFHLG